MMKFQLLKPDSENDYDMVRFYESEDGITESNIEEKLYQVGKTLGLEVGAYMVAGIEGGKYKNFLVVFYILMFVNWQCFQRTCLKE